MLKDNGILFCISLPSLHWPLLVPTPWVMQYYRQAVRQSGPRSVLLNFIPFSKGGKDTNILRRGVCVIYEDTATFNTQHLFVQLNKNLQYFNFPLLSTNFLSYGHQWPRVRRRVWSLTAQTLGSWVRIPLHVRMHATVSLCRAALCR
jgi:hypothetical protein